MWKAGNVNVLGWLVGPIEGNGSGLCVKKGNGCVVVRTHGGAGLSVQAVD
jgi:hypothetical protein